MTFSYNPNLVKTRWPPMIVSSIGLRKGAGPLVMHNTRIHYQDSKAHDAERNDPTGQFL